MARHHTIVTAADHRFFRTLRQMLRSAARHGLDRAHDFVVVDLGLTDDDRRVLGREAPWCEVTPFPFDRYPPHVRDLSCFAWKPILIANVIAERGGTILWLDSATLFHGSLAPAFARIARDGVFSLIGQTPLGKCCDGRTLSRLGVRDEDLLKPYRAGGALGFDADRTGVRALVTAWRDYALDAGCIAPPGLDRRIHRFDQAIMTALLCRFEREHGIVLPLDEIDISSIDPVRWISTRNKVAPRLPLALDSAVRAYYGIWKRADRFGLRAQRHGWLRTVARSAEGLIQTSIDRVSLRRAARRARRFLRDARSVRGHRCSCDPTLDVHLVHSEALREACDVVVDFGSNIERPERPHVPVPMLAAIAGSITAGSAIHVKSDLLASFVESVLPHIRVPFVLVTGDSDVAPVSAFAPLLDDARVLHWFAQNCDVEYDHPRLTRIPIGVDNPVYTKLDKRLGFLLAMLLGRIPFDRTLSRNGMGDQKLLQAVSRRATRTFREKPARALCTFHRNSILLPNADTITDRRDAVEQLRDRPDCHFIERRLAQAEYWEAHQDFAFEVSPRGSGLDCFRTWECLFLETVPIVKASALDALYRQERLPVAVVESWREVTSANLRRWQTELADRFTPDLRRRLTADYWRGQIEDAKRQGEGTTPRRLVSTRVPA